MAILFAAAAAIGWGASDFFGGDASRRDTSVFVIVALSELLGVLLLLPALVVRGVAPPTNPRLLFAVLAGVAVTAELGLIYRALSRGDAFITAPVGALGAAGAVTIGLIGGDPLGNDVAHRVIPVGHERRDDGRFDAVDAQVRRADCVRYPARQHGLPRAGKPGEHDQSVTSARYRETRPSAADPGSGYG